MARERPSRRQRRRPRRGTPRPAEYGSYPDRYNVQASATYVTGTHSDQGRLPGFLGSVQPDRLANADLYQNYTRLPA